jgi:uroporphyrin-III C-methyltransferase
MTSILQQLAHLQGGQLPEFAPSSVWLAGAGPGDPAHLTLGVATALHLADVIVYDALVDDRVLALAAPGAVLEFAGKRGGKPSAQQADITSRLIELAREGRRVLRLKGGDPFIFGRGGEEVVALIAAGIPFRVLPGLTSGLAALALSGMPGTMRGVNQALVLATGHGADGEGAPDWAALAQLDQPILIYMGMKNLPIIAAALMEGGMKADKPAAAIAWAGTDKQRRVTATLTTLADAAAQAGLEAPAILVIGDIAETDFRGL